jgi:hypothetical protein
MDFVVIYDQLEVLTQHVSSYLSKLASYSHTAFVPSFEAFEMATNHSNLRRAISPLSLEARCRLNNSKNLVSLSP